MLGLGAFCCRCGSDICVAQVMENASLPPETTSKSGVQQILPWDSLLSYSQLMLCGGGLLIAAESCIHMCRRVEGTGNTCTSNDALLLRVLCAFLGGRQADFLPPASPRSCTVQIVD